MKKISSIIAIVLVGILSFSSCSKDYDEKSILESLNGTSWNVFLSGTEANISFYESQFDLVMSEQGFSITLFGDYVYTNPKFTTSNHNIPGTTIKGHVSNDGEILFLTINGETVSMTSY